MTAILLAIADASLGLQRRAACAVDSSRDLHPFPI